MNKAKEYKLYPTAKKTAKENGLTLSDNGEYLYDFSLLDGITEISDEDKEYIKKTTVKNNICIASNSNFYGYFPDNFRSVSGIADFSVVKRVYNKKTYHRRYCILGLAHLKHYHGERDNVWENYFTKNCVDVEKYSYVYDEGDIEL